MQPRVIHAASCGCAGTGEESGRRAALVEAFAWDAPGDRLALAYSAEGENERSAARIAVFAMQQKPILSMRLLGLAAEPRCASAGKWPAPACCTPAHSCMSWSSTYLGQ